MRRSLQRRLTLMLGGSILCAAVLATSTVFILAYREAAEFQDDLLRQIAVLTDTRTPYVVHRHVTTSPTPGDPDSRISLVQLPADPRPEWLPEALPPGFHRLATPLGALRVFVRVDEDAGRRTIVAQPTETRDEIALASAVQSLVPLLLLLPLIAWLIPWIVRHALAPIGELARHLDTQPAERPGPVADTLVPDEIRPFVQAINRLLARVAELVQQQRRFIADAAHEIRSPLTALAVQAENLSQAKTLECAQQRLVPLQAGIERARKLTEQLLSLARLQANTAQTEDIDLAAFARTLIAEHLPLAESRRIDLGLEESDRFHLAASRDSLRLVLRNGLENALLYGRPGGEVTLRIALEADQMCIEIIDDGPGIPAAEREQVMQPFHRLDHASGTGSGLGLGIAREAAARLGGTLELAERGDGPGLRFRYRQPYRR